MMLVTTRKCFTGDLERRRFCIWLRANEFRLYVTERGPKDPKASGS